MKKLTAYIATVIPFLVWAHQDTYYTFEYENVTVRFKTGFVFEEVHNAKIIGKYAALLTKSMNYNKPVLLDFIHDYGHSYQGNNFSFLNVGSEEYELISFYEQKYDSILNENVFQMVPYSDSVENSKTVEKMVYSVPHINRHKKIVIRQFGYHFTVAHTLNLLYSAISNTEIVSRAAKDDTLYSYLPNMYYHLHSVSRSMVDSISRLSIPDVNKILENRVYKEIETIDRHRLFYSYFSKNGKYFVFARIHDKEIILDTLNQIYSFDKTLDFGQSLFVFETPNQFKQYNQIEFDDNFRKSKKHKVPIDRYEYIRSINVEWLTDDIYFINYHNGFGMSPFRIFPFLRNDDILITDFELYINSFRGKKE